MRLSMYKVFKPKWKFLAAVLLSAGLTGCGGGDEVEGGPPGGSSNPPSTIRISYPVSDAIQDLKGGYYRRYGSVIVTDREGNAVADGTRIRLIVIDSVKAYGTIDPGDSISGARITDAAPLLGDFTTPTFLDTAYVDRAATIHSINDTDHIFTFTSYSADRVRAVGATSASNPTNTTLDASAAYSVDYPNTLYDPNNGPAFTTQYIVGASLLGSSIAGEGGTIGYATTSDGRASFYVSYPADINHIRVGCPLAGASIDTRHKPDNSALTFVAAIVDGYEHVNVIDSSVISGVPEKLGFCFSTIRGGNITISASTGLIEGRCTDGGDGVAVPYSYVSVGTSDPNVVSVISPAITDRFGYYSTFYATGASGTATISVECNGGATNSIDIIVP